jgi:nitrogenase molybdenum-iron protein NifN
MDQVSAVMEANDNVVEGLKTLCEKSAPDLIGVPTTGLVETQGADIRMAVREFRTQYPRFDATPVVAVLTPDVAAAVKALIEDLVPEAAAAGTQPGRRPRQVNVLVGSALTPGDLEHLKDLIEAFDLRPLVLPDLSDALDGHLTGEDFSPLTIGGTPVGELSTPWRRPCDPGGGRVHGRGGGCPARAHRGAGPPLRPPHGPRRR